MRSAAFRILLAMAFLIIFPSPGGARKIKISHRIAKNAISEEMGTINSADSLISSEIYQDFQDSIAGKIRFYGFDKTVGSSTESFFAINDLPTPVISMYVKITYIDMQGRMLHSREISIPCDIPAGATRRIDIKSWDTQKSFYFHQSAKPKRQATPFKVKMELAAIRIPLAANQ